MRLAVTMTPDKRAVSYRPGSLHLSVLTTPVARGLKKLIPYTISKAPQNETGSFAGLHQTMARHTSRRCSPIESRAAQGCKGHMAILAMPPGTQGHAHLDCRRDRGYAICALSQELANNLRNL